MIEDLDQVREENYQNMKLALQTMEEARYAKTKMTDVSFLNRRTKFTVERGFAQPVMVAKLMVFVDGILRFARKNVVVDKEVSFNVNLKYTNLPLKEAKRICIVIQDVSQELIPDDPNHLYMINSEEGFLIPITAEAYKVI